MNTDYEFTSYTTNKIVDILLTMERDVRNSLCKCEDIKEGIFMAGSCIGGARFQIYELLKAEQDKSYAAKKARETRTTRAESEIRI